MKKSWGIAASVAILVSVAISSTSIASNAEDSECPVGPPPYDIDELDKNSDGKVSKSCDLVGKKVRKDGVGAVVPFPGDAVFGEAVDVDGMRTIYIRTLDDGTVSFDDGGSVQAGPGGGATGPGCNDNYSNIWNARLFGKLPWYFNRNSIPGTVVAASALDRIRDGGRHMADVDNACGLSDVVPSSVGFDYMGEANNTNTNIYGSGTTAQLDCVQRDGVSVVDFNQLPDGTLGYACWWASGMVGGVNVIVESDVRINKHDYLWIDTNTIPSPCTTQWDLEGLVTHERGHSLGIKDYLESAHGLQTMSGSLDGACQISERSLGLGDWKGLDNRY